MTSRRRPATQLMTTASTVTSIARAIQRSSAASGCEISSTTAYAPTTARDCRIASEVGRKALATRACHP